MHEIAQGAWEIMSWMILQNKSESGEEAEKPQGWSIFSAWGSQETFFREGRLWSKSWRLKRCFLKYEERKAFEEREQYTQNYGSWRQHKMLRERQGSVAETWSWGERGKEKGEKTSDEVEQEALVWSWPLYHIRRHRDFILQLKQKNLEH